MPVIDPRYQLSELLRSCSICYEEYCGNVGTITDDEGNLTEEQIPIVLEYMNRFHLNHVH
jgi:hypothetical protein